ncbi:hypothetical protein C8R45DRAFT_1108690 [Mycena sanguinolenta]|nr:hypothetical protein C8R45DRAFT_1108690 [Mycena sanguinolenta]
MNKLEYPVFDAKEHDEAIDSATRTLAVSVEDTRMENGHDFKQLGGDPAESERHTVAAPCTAVAMTPSTGGGDSGPAAVVENGGWESPLHKTSVQLRIEVDATTTYVVNFDYGFKFTTNHEGEKTTDTRHSSSALDVVGVLDLRLSTSAGETLVVVDRSYASIGFLAHRSKAIVRREFDSQPESKVSEQRSQIKTSGTGGSSEGSRSTAFKPTRRCRVHYDPGDDWDSDILSYSSYNIAYQRQDVQADSVHRLSESDRRPLELRVSMRINLDAAANSAPANFSCYSSPTADLDIGSKIEDATDADGHERGTISISIVQQPKQNASTNRFRGGVPAFLAKLGRQRSVDPGPQEVSPSYEYLSWGWNAVNDRWKYPLWPLLDKNFRPANVETTPPAWEIVHPRWGQSTPYPRPSLTDDTGNGESEVLSTDSDDNDRLQPVPDEAQPKVRGALEQQYLDQEVESKMHEFLPTFTEDGPVGNTLLSQNSLSSGAAAALLLLPAHFSTPGTIITTIASHLRENIGHFTVSSSLEKAASEDDYKRIQDHTREEWLKVGGLLVGLAALEIAVFALTPDSIFLVDGVVRITVSGSCISTSTGLLFDFYFYLRFALASIPVFKHRAQDNYQLRANGSIDRIESYVFFALIARLPLLLAMISIFFISILLAVAAYKLSPLVVLSLLGLICLILFLQYLCWGRIWVGFGLAMLVGLLVNGLANAGMWVLSAPEYVAAKARELWRSLFNYKYLYHRS